MRRLTQQDSFLVAETPKTRPLLLRIPGKKKWTNQKVAVFEEAKVYWLAVFRDQESIKNFFGSGIILSPPDAYSAAHNQASAYHLMTALYSGTQSDAAIVPPELTSLLPLCNFVGFDMRTSSSSSSTKSVIDKMNPKPTSRLYLTFADSQTNGRRLIMLGSNNPLSFNAFLDKVHRFKKESQPLESLISLPAYPAQAEEVNEAYLTSRQVQEQSSGNASLLDLPETCPGELGLHQHGAYQLEIDDASVVVTSADWRNDSRSVRWPFAAIRRYGVITDSQVFWIEAGSKAATGSGFFRFRVTDAPELFELMRKKQRSLAVSSSTAATTSRNLNENLLQLPQTTAGGATAPESQNCEGGMTRWNSQSTMTRVLPAVPPFPDRNNKQNERQTSAKAPRPAANQQPPQSNKSREIGAYLLPHQLAPTLATPASSTSKRPTASESPAGIGVGGGVVRGESSAVSPSSWSMLRSNAKDSAVVRPPVPFGRPNEVAPDFDPDSTYLEPYEASQIAGINHYPDNEGGDEFGVLNADAGDDDDYGVDEYEGHLEWAENGTRSDSSNSFDCQTYECELELDGFPKVVPDQPPVSTAPKVTQPPPQPAKVSRAPSDASRSGKQVMETRTRTSDPKGQTEDDGLYRNHQATQLTDSESRLNSAGQSERPPPSIDANQRPNPTPIPIPIPNGGEKKNVATLVSTMRDKIQFGASLPPQTPPKKTLGKQ